MVWDLPSLQLKPVAKYFSVANANNVNIVAVFQDFDKKAIASRVSTLPKTFLDCLNSFKKSEVFSAKKGSCKFAYVLDQGVLKSILFVGLGHSTDCTLESLRCSGAQAWHKLLSTQTSHLNILHSMVADQLGAFAEGMLLAAYRFDKYKTVRDVPEYVGPSSIDLFVESISDLSFQQAIKRVIPLGQAVHLTRDWSNEPSNIGHPLYFAEQAKKLAKQYSLKYRVLNLKDALEEKMGLFLGVGQGSHREGCIVIVEYTPKAFKKSIALVGKGVTFDSGGISIKPSARMEDMKHDMTGAATVMGALLLAAQWKIKNKLIGVMAFTENMPGGKAIQPGNILTARNGKTVEIVNTDAEGRLVLADALDYAQDLQPDVVVDIATLTGAVGVALGKIRCAIFGNNDHTIRQLQQAADFCAERVWRLPLDDEYFEDMKSDYADMKNAVNDSYGGTIRGAIFLKQFIRKKMPWVHLDIALTAYDLGGLKHLPYFPRKGASGAYVRTLAKFAADY